MQTVNSTLSFNISLKATMVTGHTLEETVQMSCFNPIHKELINNMLYLAPLAMLNKLITHAITAE